MKKLAKTGIAVILMLVVAFLIVFALAKNKVILINEWFVDRDAETFGVDISSYQATVDMNRLKEQDVSFVYIKATEGSGYQDERFAENWAHATEAGLPCGAYHFFSYDSEGALQAQNFIQTVGPDMTGRLLPVVDVEYYGDKEEYPPAKEDVVRELSSYLAALEAQYGVKPMIYTRVDIYKLYLEGTFDEYKIWMSSLYNPLSWIYRDNWYIWQYLDRGELDGYSGGERYIDFNILNRDKSLDELIVV